MPKCFFLLLLTLPLLGFCQPDWNRARRLFAEKQYPGAKKEYLVCLGSDSNNKEALERLGDICCFSKDWKHAARYYSKWMVTDTRNADAHYKYGGALSMDAASGPKWRALGMIGDIRASFEKTIALAPKHIDAHWALVEYYLQLPGILGGSESKAAYYADELLKISPVDHYLAKGRIEEHFDRLQMAEKYYLKAHAAGNSETTLKKLLSLYTKMNRPDKAKAASEAFKPTIRGSSKPTI